MLPVTTVPAVTLGEKDLLATLSGIFLVFVISAYTIAVSFR